jgi:dTDP-4-amino-4,6-dideoxygalactose transaminase
VLTVANAGGYATTAIRATGATPAYVDVDADLLGMDPAPLAHAITPRTRAIVVTHLYGRLAHIDAIARLAQERDVPLIEDCAQAHGASLDGRKAGTFGAVGCYSFYPTKNLGALGDAGALVTSDPALAARIAELRTYGWRSKYRVATPGGMNSRMDELQAAVLRVKLPHLDAWNARRREIALRYAAAIENPLIELPPTLPGSDDVVHLYVVRTEQRDALRAHLGAVGIATDVHYPVPDHRQPGWADAKPPRLPHTERACDEVLTLPCYPELKEAEIAAVAAACNAWQPATRS